MDSCLLFLYVHGSFAALARSLLSGSRRRMEGKKKADGTEKESRWSGNAT